MNNNPQPQTDPRPSLATTVPKQSNKGLIGLLIGLGVIGFLVIVGILVYFTFFHISATDYQRIGEQTNVMIDNYNKASDAAQDYLEAVGDPTASDEEIKESANTYHSSYNAFLGNMQALAKERAMRNGDIQAAYDKLVTKSKSFIDNNASLEEAIPTLRKVAVNCDEEKIAAMDTDDLGGLVAAYDAAVGPCAESMKTLASAKNIDVAKIGEKAVVYFDEMRTYVVNMETAYKTNDRTKFEKEYSEFIKKVNSFDDDASIKSIQKRQDSLAPTAELNDLAKVINQR